MAAPRRRMLIDLGHGGSDGGGIEAAALVARRLELDLLGIFVEDEALLALAGHSFARELRLPSHAWSAMAPQEVAAGLGLAAEASRRLLAAQCARLGIAGGFEVRRGDPGDCVAGLCEAADILALGAPESAAGRTFGSFPRAWRAALGSAASVLLLPARPARRGGPVAALAGAGEAGGLALRLAQAAGERLLLLEPPGVSGAAMEDSAGRAAVAVTRRRIGGTGAGAILEGLGAAQESLLVLARDAAQAGDGPPRIAAQRRIPVLVR